MKTLGAVLFAAVLLAGGPARAQDAGTPAVPAQESVVQVPASAAGQTISYLLRTQNDANPRFVALLMPGGDGLMQFRTEDGQLKFNLAGNFLVRSRRHWIDRETAVAVLDAPSDMQTTGYSDQARALNRHAQDVHAVIADLRQRFPAARMVLVGTSMGTLSSAWVAKHLQDELEATVHTSTIASPARGIGLPMWRFDYGAIKIRQLVVHHADDMCKFTRYADARAFAEKYGIPLITVRGGRDEGEFCGPFGHHGMRDREIRVIQAIKSWLRGEPAPESIE